MRMKILPHFKYHQICFTLASFNHFLATLVHTTIFLEGQGSWNESHLLQIVSYFTLKKKKKPKL